MVTRRIRALGVSVIAVAASLTATCVAMAAPNAAAPITDGRGDRAPQRFLVAQASNGGSATSGFPGGASSLSETYTDWQVACALQGSVKRCALSQVQTQQNGQRVLTVELSAPSGTTVSGTLVLPFGLALDSGVTLQIDDKPAMQPIRFRTCLPVGCIVSVTFDAPTLLALRAGTALKLKATADGGAAAPFSIPLQGFATALDRIGALSR